MKATLLAESSVFSASFINIIFHSALQGRVEPFSWWKPLCWLKALSSQPPLLILYSTGHFRVELSLSVDESHCAGWNLCSLSLLLLILYSIVQFRVELNLSVDESHCAGWNLCPLSLLLLILCSIVHFRVEVSLSVDESIYAGWKLFMHFGKTELLHSSELATMDYTINWILLLIPNSL